MAEPETEVTILLQPEGTRLPANLTCLARFREWARSESFPERGRIDWIGGQVEVDMSPEDLNAHGTLKAAIAGDLRPLVEGRDLGVLFVDRARLSADEAGLSVEPDVLVLLFATVDSGRARLVPRAHGPDQGFIEIEGAADIVVECVSDSSKEKDRRRLPLRYYSAGVQEYWLVDGRRETLEFVLFRRGNERYEETGADPEGFLPSQVLGVGVRLVRLPRRSGLDRYRLEHRPL